MIRWRIKVSFDMHQLYWILASWLPLFLWACFTSIFVKNPFIIILFFFGSISLQLVILLFNSTLKKKLYD